MISNKMGFTGQGLYYGQDFSGGEFHAHEWKHDVVANMATLFG